VVYVSRPDPEAGACVFSIFFAILTAWAKGVARDYVIYSKGIDDWAIFGAGYVFIILTAIRVSWEVSGADS